MTRGSVRAPAAARCWAGRLPARGSVLRLWCAERLAESSGASNISGAPWIIAFARVGRRDRPRRRPALAPPVNRIAGARRRGVGGAGGRSRRVVDRRRHRADRRDRGQTRGDGRLQVDALPGGRSSGRRHRRTGFRVRGRVGLREQWASSPAAKVRQRARPDWPAAPFAPHTLGGGHGIALVLASIPLSHSAPASLCLPPAWPPVDGCTTSPSGLRSSAATLVSLLDLCSHHRRIRAPTLDRHHRRLPPGAFADRLAGVAHRTGPRCGTHLPLPLYASLLTPLWFRILGAEGRAQHRISTALVLPKFDYRRRRLPRRRHHGRLLRVGRRLVAHRRGVASASTPSWGTPGSPGPDVACQERTGRRLVGRTRQGEGGVELAGQPTGPVAARGC